MAPGPGVIESAPASQSVMRTTVEGGNSGLERKGWQPPLPGTGQLSSTWQPNMIANWTQTHQYHTGLFPENSTVQNLPKSADFHIP